MSTDRWASDNGGRANGTARSITQWKEGKALREGFDVAKEAHTPDSIEETAHRLEVVASDLRKAAGDLRRRRIRKILVNFERCRIKGLGWVESWNATLNRTIRETADGYAQNQDG
jgi:hypothetical protein